MERVSKITKYARNQRMRTPVKPVRECLHTHAQTDGQHKNIMYPAPFVAQAEEYHRHTTDLLNLLQHSDDYLTIMPKLRSIYQTSYEERKAFLRYDSLA